MLKTVIAGLRRPVRLLLSAVAIALGVAFVSGSFILTDSVRVGVRAAVAYQMRGVDLEITSPRGVLDDASLARVRQVAGVGAAEGRLQVSAPVAVDGRVRDAGAMAVPADPQLRPFDLAGGRLPNSAAEVATAQELRYRTGQSITVYGRDGTAHVFSVVGTFYRPLDAGIGAPQFLLSVDGLRQLAPQANYGRIDVHAASGAHLDELTKSLTSAVPGTHVATAADAAEELIAEAAPGSAGLTGFFSAFAVLSVIVAGLVIVNSFTILVTQRSRELALLRCVGASRGQVFGSVLAEAAVVGAASSVVGLAGGIGVAAALQAIANDPSIGVYVPVSARTAVESVVIGVLVTVLAAVLPARLATRVAPVAALRSRHETPTGRAGRPRAAVGIVSLLTGVSAGVLATFVETSSKGALMVLAMAALLLAALTFGPLLIGPVVRVLSAAFAPVLGYPAKLAALNADRNPRRTAATAAALTIGLAVVTLITTMASGVEVGNNRGLDNELAANYTVTMAVSNRSLPADLATTLAQIPGVASTATRKSFSGDLGSLGPYSMAAVQADALGSLLHPPVLSGTLDRFGAGDLAVSSELARITALEVGDTVRAAHDGTVPLRVTAIYDSIRAPSLDLGLAFVDLSQQQAIASHGSPAYDESVLVRLSPTADADRVRAALTQALSSEPLAQLNSIADLKQQMAAPLRSTLNLMWALTALAVLIAFAGVANTMSLSVIERTRESALLRALGLTTRRLGATVMTESVFVALFGAACGLVVGIVSAWLFARVASTDARPIVFVLPWGRLGILVAGAVLAAALATLAPARHAARGTLVSAITT
ncbi:FtsX-like permease family protein [Dactylosporangium matsuzakiense]|uniref:Membrane protein n=1 Tax=Dactylosporangium matsuzakiense TaxID=53360 RepID=A0A9W6NJN5_9ACTN|nr:FtsX-like permease family protein [Dactylosporangium matsuzakiense]GLK99245.1 membrane protein [Dactylosporangium matsuzakiense]